MEFEETDRCDCGHLIVPSIAGEGLFICSGCGAIYEEYRRKTWRDIYREASRGDEK